MARWNGLGMADLAYETGLLILCGMGAWAHWEGDPGATVACVPWSHPRPSSSLWPVLWPVVRMGV